MIEKIIVDCDGIRLDNFLAGKLDKSRSQIKNLIDNNRITLDGKCVKAGILIKCGQLIQAEVDDEVISDILPEDIPLEIVYEDDDLAVINKPQGMVVHPSSGCYTHTLVNAIMYRMKSLSSVNGLYRPGIVHRLDKDTSGLIVIAKNDKAHRCLAKQIENKDCKRIYHAIVEGKMKEEGTITTHIARGTKERKKMFVVGENEGKLAITHYKTLEYLKGASLVEFALQTGRTHQIRVHCAYLGHAVIGDKVYGKEVSGLNGQLLHAYKLIFTHPKTKKLMEFVAKEPDYFVQYLNKLRTK